MKRFLSQLCPLPSRHQLSCPEISRPSIVVGRLLDSCIPSYYKGEVAQTIRELLSYCLSPVRAHLQLMKIVLCLVANNMLPNRWESVSDAEEKDPLIGFFHWIRAERYIPVLFQLLDFQLPATNILKDRLLVFAARVEDKQLLRSVLDRGARIDTVAWICYDVHMTAMHEAVKCQNLDVVQMLLHAGARVDGSAPSISPYYREVTPLGLLLYPAQKIRLSKYWLGPVDANLVKILIEAGADLHYVDGLTNLTALQKSMYLGPDDLINMIWQHDPSIQATKYL